MERSFGKDFSGVRVHHGPEAAAIGARAFTRGSDIHFAPGQYDPGSITGQELIGHELTHVVQQGQGHVAATLQAKGASINADDALEREADALGRLAVRGGPVVVDAVRGGPQGTPPGVVQRCMTAEAVIGAEKDAAAQKQLLRAYLGELQDKADLRLTAAYDDDTLSSVTLDEISKAGTVLEKRIEATLGGFDLTEDVSILTDLVDDCTETYRTFKARVAEVSKPQVEVHESKEVRATPSGPAFDQPIDTVVSKRLGLKGNSRPIRSSTVELVTEKEGLIRGLKQALLNESTSAMASVELTEAWSAVRQRVEECARMSSDAEVREYWTMKHGGLVDALNEAEVMLRGELTCNEELADLLKGFLTKNRTKFERM